MKHFLNCIFNSYYLHFSNAHRAAKNCTHLKQGMHINFVKKRTIYSIIGNLLYLRFSNLTHIIKMVFKKYIYHEIL